MLNAKSVQSSPGLRYTEYWRFILDLLFCLAVGLAVVVWPLDYVCLAVSRSAFGGGIEDNLFLLRYCVTDWDSFLRKRPLFIAIDSKKAFDSKQCSTAHGLPDQGLADRTSGKNHGSRVGN